MDAAKVIYASGWGKSARKNMASFLIPYPTSLVSRVNPLTAHIFTAQEQDWSKHIWKIGRLSSSGMYLKMTTRMSEMMPTSISSSDSQNGLMFWYDIRYL